MKKLAFLITIIFIGLVIFNFLSCSDKDKEIKNLTGKVTYYSECNSHIDSTMSYSSSISTTTNANTIFIERKNYYYNCCADYITINYNIKDGIINITELESCIAANCICLRDLSYIITDIPSGIYKIITQPHQDTLKDIIVW